MHLVIRRSPSNIYTNKSLPLGTFLVWYHWYHTGHPIGISSGAIQASDHNWYIAYIVDLKVLHLVLDWYFSDSALYRHSIVMIS